MCFFQFEIIINVLVSSSRFSMLWVYAHYNFFNSFSPRIDFRRQNIMCTDVRLRAERVNHVKVHTSHPLSFTVFCKVILSKYEFYSKNTIYHGYTAVHEFDMTV